MSGIGRSSSALMSLGQELYRDYIEIMEKKMETTIEGLGFPIKCRVCRLALDPVERRRPQTEEVRSPPLNIK